MSQPKVLVLRTAGTNCDAETVHAWELAGASAQRMHVRELIDRPALLSEFGILTIPGGFSYGDDISAGKILATQMIHHLREPLAEFVAAGKLVLGICNGFQVMVKAGLLPGPGCASAEDLGTSPQASAAEGTEVVQPVTLTLNDSARFEARWVHLRSTGNASAFLPADHLLEFPIAHAEGKLVCRDQAVRQHLIEHRHVALTYCDDKGCVGAYPINPNGSEAAIAGLTDNTGRVLGLMPHPERHVDPTQHPEWTRRKSATADGRLLFETAVRHAR